MQPDFTDRTVEPPAANVFTMTAAQKKNHQDHYNANLVKTTVSKMKHEAMTRFGSLRGFFRELDEDGSGDVDWKEFHHAMDHMGLGEAITKEEQRVVFDAIDEGGTGIEYMQFAKLFDPDLVACQSHKHASNEADSYQKDKMTPRTYYDMERLKEKIVERVMLKAKHNKVAYKNNAQMLMNTFNDLDDDGDGALTYDDVKQALGPNFLDLGFNEKQVNQILLASDENQDGLCSFKEFVAFLSLHDVDPSYSPFYNARKRQINALDDMKNAPMKWQDLYDERCKPKQPPPKDSSGLNLEKQPNEGYHAMLDSTHSSMPGALASNNKNFLRRTNDRTGLDKVLPGSMTPALRERVCAKVHSGGELLEKLQEKNIIEYTAPGRFSGSVKYAPGWQKTDYGRVGFGGDGIDRKSGMHADSMEQFRTTRDVFYGGQYGREEPDEAKTTQKADFNRRKFDIKGRTLHDHKARVMNNYQYQENVHKMEEEGRLKALAKTRLGYFDTLYQQVRGSGREGLPRKGGAGAGAVLVLVQAVAVASTTVVFVPPSR
jgi:Ca2+-binding EF-hand superfamily protein